MTARALQDDFVDTASDPPEKESTPPQRRKNPWRNFKPGKALCQRAAPPKFYPIPIPNAPIPHYHFKLPYLTRNRVGSPGPAVNGISTTEIPEEPEKSKEEPEEDRN